MPHAGKQALWAVQAVRINETLCRLRRDGNSRESLFSRNVSKTKPRSSFADLIYRILHKISKLAQKSFAFVRTYWLIFSVFH